MRGRKSGLFSQEILLWVLPKQNMVMEIIISVILLFVGIAVLVLIHVCVVGRAFSRYNNGGTIGVVQRRIIRGIPSMSIDDIEKLPCFDYKVEVEENGHGSMECAVCLETFREGEKCRLLPNCRHSFHALCLDSWLMKTAVCPICRRGAQSLSNIGEESSTSTEIGVELT